MNGVRIYVSDDINNKDIILNGTELDLFDDENIQIVLKQTDIRDISTNYADYSQPFTIPASPKNNKTFKYWYDTFYDGQLPTAGNIPCRIDIGGVLFKRGLLKIQGAQKDANGKIKHYLVNFTSDLKSLKDKFGDKKIGDLDFTGCVPDVEFQYNDSVVLGGIINNSNGTIEFPLISTTRLLENFTAFQYANPSTANGIKKEELRPAIKFRAIFEAIENNFDVRFVGNFHSSNDSKLDSLYLWLNRNENPFKTSAKVLNLTGTSSVPSNFITGLTNSVYFDIPNDYFTITRKSFINYHYGIYNQINTSNTTTKYKIFLQQIILNTDGTVDEVNSFAQDNSGFVASTDWVTGTKTLNYGVGMSRYPVGTKLAYRLAIETQGDLTISSVKIMITNHYFNHSLPGLGVFQQGVVSLNSTTPIVFPALFNIQLNLPEITVQDFITSVIKMFNLVILPVTNPQIQSLLQSQNVFQLEYYNSYYNNYNSVDITNYTNRAVKINSVKNYKKYEFKHADSSYGTNIIFKNSQTPIREYGSFKEEYPNGDDGELKVETKFNLLIFREMLNAGMTSSGEMLLNQSWITSDSLNEDFSKGVFNKPTIFFYNEKSQTPSNKKLAFTDINNVSSPITQYSIFSNVDSLEFTDYTTTNTFSNEGFFNSNIRTKSLYYNNYKKIVTGINSRYSREYEVEANLPKSIYTNLNLGTHLVIGNNRYTINDLTINLLSGNTKLKLNNVFEENDIPEMDGITGIDGVSFFVDVISSIFYNDSLGGFIEKNINISYPINTAKLCWRLDYNLTTQTYSDARVMFTSTAAYGLQGLLWFDFNEPSGQAVGSHTTTINNFIPVGTYTLDNAAIWGGYNSPINCQLRARTGNTITLTVWCYDDNDILLGSSSVTI